MNSPFAEAILSGSLLLAIPVALLAGFVSFLSPCVLPLVPGYLGYVTGLTGVDLQKQKRGRMLAGIGLFVLGFSVIFVDDWAMRLFGSYLVAASISWLGYGKQLMRIVVGVFGQAAGVACIEHDCIPLAQPVDCELQASPAIALVRIGARQVEHTLRVACHHHGQRPVQLAQEA